MGFRKKDVDDLLVKTGHVCCICRTHRSVQTHHIVPIADDGSDDIDNCIPLCPNCHDEVHRSRASGGTTRAYTPAMLKGLREETIRLAAEGRLPRVVAAPVPRAARALFVEPKLPDHFVPRSKEFDALVKAVLGSGGGKSVAITTALAGAGGFGKTTLAAALCHDKRVRKHFSDGILWVTLGQTPDLLACLTTLYAEITDERPGFASEEDAANSLARVLDGLKCLIVIDDVWNEGHLRYFPSGAGDCVRLITTRNQGIAGDNAVPVDEMTGDESIEMLTARLPALPHDLKPFQELAALLGEWPLLLELANAALRKRLRHRDSVDSALEYVRAAYGRHGFRAFDRASEGDRNAAAEASLAATLDLLKKPERVRLAELSIFPEDIRVPVSAVAAMWGVDAPDAEKQLEEFADLSVLRLDLGSGSFRMHDVLRTALQDQLKDPAEPHKRIIRSWGDPRKLPDDYAWRWYAYHVVGAGRRDDLRKLLLDFDWLLAKLENTDCVALTSDFDYFPGDKELELVQGAVRLSSNAVAGDPCQLASQLCGRLGAFESREIAALTRQARSWRGAMWLQPMSATLTPPGGPLILTLHGHWSFITAVALSLDCRVAVSGSRDTTIRLWDLETGREKATLRGHTDRVTTVAMSADGNTIVSGSYDRTVRVWDLERGKVRILTGHTDAVNAVALTPDGKMAVSCARDKSIRVWNLETGRETRTLAGHRDAVTAVAVTEMGGCVFPASDDSTVRMWNLHSGKTVVLARHTYRVTSLAVTPDGKWAIWGTFFGGIEVYDLERRKEKYSFREPAPIWAVAVTSDGRWAISGSYDATIKVWDLARGVERGAVLGHTAWVSAVAMSSDGNRAVSGSHDCTVRLWDLGKSTTLASRTAHADSVTSLASTADGARAVSGSDDRTVKVWDVGTRREKHTLAGHDMYVTVVAVTPDGRTAFSGSYDSTIRMWDVETGECTGILEGHKGAVLSVAVSGDGTRLVSGSDDKTIKLWDVEHGREIRTLPRSRSPVLALAISPDGERAISGSEDGRVRVWDLQTVRRVRTLSGHTGPVYAVAFNSDGSGAISSSWDATIRFWDLEAGREIHTLIGHFGGVRAVVMASDNQLVVSASDDYTVRVWDLEAATSVAEFVCDSEARSVTLSTDGLIVCGERSGRIHFLRLEGLDT